ncbi:Mitochondrial oxaloacetate carrier protein [Allomyces javanicus]|nr:Mitochondrial oxaloacetate carrier protein [Allomyces javanicus]
MASSSSPSPAPAASEPALALPCVYPPSEAPRKLDAVTSFTISSIAPGFAVVFTNPFDTANTYFLRLQLQGERLRAAQSGAASAPSVVYKNSFDCMYKTLKMEGVRGLQKGLSPAILREGSKNIFRLGMYDPIIALMHDATRGPPPAWKMMIAGSICGAMGALACNPFELVKTRLQSAAHGSLAVGHQHGYTGIWMALKSIVAQDGTKGLYRGSAMSVGRSIVGSGANLSAFHVMKNYLMAEHGWADNVTTDMVAGMSSGLASVICMNPIDVLRTRYYNQPYVNGRGTIYASGWDAAKTVVANEGYRALYKGFLSHFLRIGPHFCLTFVFLGMFRRSIIAFRDGKDEDAVFAALDADHDGVVNAADFARAVRLAAPALDADAVVHHALSGAPNVARSAFSETTAHLRAAMRDAQLRAAFTRLDAARRGSIDAADLAKAGAKDSAAVVAWIDKDMDGRVSYADFAAAARDVPGVHLMARPEADLVAHWSKVAGIAAAKAKARADAEQKKAPVGGPVVGAPAPSSS